MLTKPELDWDTTALAEGKYRVRVDASDEMVNPPGDVTQDALVSEPVWVDNTPPTIQDLTLQGRRLRARVVDGVGPIQRVEASTDGRNEWRPIAPVDGIFDTADEPIDIDLSRILDEAGPGAHIVTIRAYDAAGNSVLREVQLQ